MARVSQINRPIVGQDDSGTGTDGDSSVESDAALDVDEEIETLSLED